MNKQKLSIFPPLTKSGLWWIKKLGSLPEYERGKLLASLSSNPSVSFWLEYIDDLIKSGLLPDLFKYESKNKVESYKSHAQELDDVVHTPISEKHHWGYHLLIDASECSGFDNHDKIREFFSTLIENINMKPISDLFIKSVDNEEMGRGTSALQLISTSHISCHGDDQNKRIFFDCFSCAPYDKVIVINLFKEFFKPKNLNFKWIYRDAGTDHIK